ncbi:hypothetical protein KQX54_011540 [Cotesia glomerata]|uniref:Uncharacterized protein n=1 Tax=Cotesia glomerata TaxID=32391 RepID=A0AAV7J5H9_COTGL|nr:hypothetical protein KQX54_011540 [Cotesia glomerata]
MDAMELCYVLSSEQSTTVNNSKGDTRRNSCLVLVRYLRYQCAGVGEYRIERCNEFTFNKTQLSCIVELCCVVCCMSIVKLKNDRTHNLASQLRTLAALAVGLQFP